MIDAHPYTGNLPYCFVSYAHVDAERVSPYVKEMCRRGARVWFDEGIDPGTEWVESIADRLERCSLFVVFLSRNSLSSANVRREIHFAVAHDKTMLCLFLEECDMSSGMRLQLGATEAVYLASYPSPASATDRLFVAVPEACIEQNGRAATSPDGGDSSGRVRKRTHSKTPIVLLVLSVFVLAALAIVLSLHTLREADTPTQNTNQAEESLDQPDVDAVAITDDSVEEDPEPTMAHTAETLPRNWHGTYYGHSTNTGEGNVTVKRTIDMSFDYVSSDGVIRGDCRIESADSIDGYMQCSYTIAGNVDFNDGTIELYGDEWIDQGDFSYMRQFKGTLDEAWEGIDGTSSDLGDDSFTTAWEMQAVA